MSLPYTRNSQTSIDAAESSEESQGIFAEQLWRWLLSRGSEGATDDEMLTAFPARGNAVRGRRGDLVFSGLAAEHPDRIVRQTRSRKDAQVWVAVQPDADFATTFRHKPANRTPALERALREAAQAWVAAQDEDTFEALLDAAWAAYGEGPRPRPSFQTEDME